MTITSLSDSQLVEKYIQGNENCLEVLITRYKKNVFTYLMQMLKNEHIAEDIFQETFIKVIKSLKRGKYIEEGRFLSWVIRIAHNMVIDYFRKEKNKKTLSNDDYELDIFNSTKFSDDTVEQELVTDQIHSDVRELVDLLPDEQKEVVVLRHYNQMSFKEIAEQTNVSINTALGRMRYAIINLRKMIEEKDLILTEM